MFATVFDTLPVFYLMTLSGLFCLPILALSMVNFGLLSIWLNAAVAIMISVHHIVLGAVTWTSRKYRQSPKVIIDDEESSPLHNNDGVEPPAAYSLTNIAFLVFLVILNAIAFSVMVDITTQGGVKSTLPAERVGHKWNLHIQIGQSSLLGVELLTLSALLTISCLGRARLISEADNRKEELEY